jgi:uncharacterized LabA/DUF88 family protein
MGLDIERLILTEKKPGTIAIVAGDADFVQVIDDAHAEKWKIEVWYWSNAAHDLKKVADRYEELDAAIDKIGFEQK